MLHLLLTGRTSEAEVALAIPGDFTIRTPVPNPFTATTSLPLSLKKSAKATITIVSELGTEEVLLRDRTMGPGEHSLPIDLSKFSAGVYTVRVFINAQFTGSRKMVKLTK